MQWLGWSDLFAIIIVWRDKSQPAVNRDMHGMPSHLHGKSQLNLRSGFIPNPNTNPPRLPAGVVTYQSFVRAAVPRTPSIASRVLSSHSRLNGAYFKPRQIISAKEFAALAMSLLKNPPANLALQFLQIRKIDAESAILKTVNGELCRSDLLGVYSESPFLRPVLLLRDVQFAAPTNALYQFPDPENMVRQLRDLADQKVASVPLFGMISGLKPTALNLGYSTDYLMHVFNVELDFNLMAFLNEQTKAGYLGDRYRVVLRFGWATQGLFVPPNPAGSSSSKLRLLAPEALPRCLQLRVARRPVALPEPIFHAGQAVKLGHRLRYSIDITDKIPMRAASLGRSRNVEIEMTWLHAPLEDHAQGLLECVSSGALTPVVNHVINMPLVQVTLDRVESVPKIVRTFALAVAGQTTDELPVQSLHPPPANAASVPRLTPERLLGVYDFCAPLERVISVEKTLEMLKKKMALQDDLLCDDWIPGTLLCPLTLTRIEIPVRSVNCDHLQCFDLASYLTINKRRPRWNCPVCGLSAAIRDLRRDDFFLRLLMDKNLADAEQVKVDAEGNCRIVLADSACAAASGVFNDDANVHNLPTAPGGTDDSCKGNDDRNGYFPSSSASPFKADPYPRKQLPPSPPPSPCIVIDDDSDDNAASTTNGKEKVAESNVSVAKDPGSWSAPSIPPSTSTDAVSSTFPQSSPVPVAPQNLSDGVFVDLTELSNDSDDGCASPSPKSSRFDTVPHPSSFSAVVPLATTLAPSPSILLIPSKTATPGVASTNSQSAADFQACPVTLLPMPGGQLAFLPDPQTTPNSGSTAFVVPQSVQVVGTTTPAASVSPSGSTAAPNCGGPDMPPPSSRSGRFKVTAKRRSHLLLPVSSAANFATLSANPLIVSPPLATTAFCPTPSTGIADITTSPHRLRSSCPAVPPPPSSAKSVIAIFVDDVVGDSSVPSSTSSVSDGVNDNRTPTPSNR